MHENFDAFIKFVTLDMGFSHGIPITTFTKYKYILHWKYLEAEKTNIFERLIQIYISASEVLPLVSRNQGRQLFINLVMLTLRKIPRLCLELITYSIICILKLKDENIYVTLFCTMVKEVMDNKIERKKHLQNAIPHLTQRQTNSIKILNGPINLEM